MDDHRQVPPAPSDTTTNAFTSSEIAQNHSGDTNPLTSAEREQRPGSNPLAQENLPPRGGSQTRGADIRFMLYPCPGRPMAITITARGGKPKAAYQQPVILDAAAARGSGSPAISKLSVAQSGLDVPFHVRADALAGRPRDPRTVIVGEVLNLDICYEPSGDRMILVNLNDDSIMVQSVHTEQDQDSRATGPAMELDRSAPLFLDPGSWAVSTAANGPHMVQFTICPRRYPASTTTEPQARDLQNAKRALEASQPIAPARKGRTEPPGPGAGATVVFQTDPVPVGAAVVAEAAGALPGATPEPVRHPLQLDLGATATVIGNDGRYSLTCCEASMVRRNSLVFKARHSGVPEAVAAKVLRTPSYAVAPGTPDDSDDKIVLASQMWLREFRNYSKISKHNTVVHPYDADARFLSLYMEHVDAPNLASYRQKGGMGRLGIEDAQQILADISAAISHVHGQGMLHNDIKPANILYRRARRAVLIDFGLSTELTARTVHAGGTRWYIPPEYTGEGTRGPPGDVYALGVVMLFVLGRVPLPDVQEDPSEAIAEVRRGDGERARRATDGWYSIVKGASAGLKTLEHAQLGELVSEMVQKLPDRISVEELLWRQGLGQAVQG